MGSSDGGRCRWCGERSLPARAGGDDFEVDTCERCEDLADRGSLLELIDRAMRTRFGDYRAAPSYEVGRSWMDVSGRVVDWYRRRLAQIGTDARR